MMGTQKYKAQFVNRAEGEPLAPSYVRAMHQHSYLTKRILSKAEGWQSWGNYVS